MSSEEYPPDPDMTEDENEMDKMRTFEGLPGVKIPLKAFNPKVSVTAPSGAGRSRDTVIVVRGARGLAALTPKNMEPSEDQLKMRDFSHLYPEHVQKWNKDYLNEVAFATHR